MRVEGYLWAGTPLWMWQDEVAERLVEVQEFWLRLRYLVGNRNNKPHYGKIFEDWHALAQQVALQPIHNGRVMPFIYGEPWWI